MLYSTDSTVPRYSFKKLKERKKRKEQTDRDRDRERQRETERTTERETETRDRERTRERERRLGGMSTKEGISLPGRCHIMQIWPSLILCVTATRRHIACCSGRLTLFRISSSQLPNHRISSAKDAHSEHRFPAPSSKGRMS